MRFRLQFAIVTTVSMWDGEKVHFSRKISANLRFAFDFYMWFFHYLLKKKTFFAQFRKWWKCSWWVELRCCCVISFFNIGLNKQCSKPDKVTSMLLAPSPSSRSDAAALIHATREGQEVIQNWVTSSSVIALQPASPLSPSFHLSGLLALARTEPRVQPVTFHFSSVKNRAEARS